MTKFRGKVGFVQAGTLVNGVWKPNVIERFYKGDILNETLNYVPTEQVFDDKNLSVRISIVADAYSTERYDDIRYLIKDGDRRIVTSVEVKRPRLILSLGGIYVGETPPDPV